MIDHFQRDLAAHVHADQVLSVHSQGGYRRDDDPTLMGIERTTSLVRVGPYKWIRHPIYSSGVIGVWGVFFKDPSWPGVLLGMAATGFWVITAKIEETECIRFFGPAYRTYMEDTKMFIPFLF